MEARVGIEPTHKGFADLSLTTWVPRLAVGHRTPAREVADESGLAVSVWLVLPNCTSCQSDGVQHQGCKQSDRNEIIGAGDRGRTGDIFLGKEALYH